MQIRSREFAVVALVMLGLLASSQAQETRRFAKDNWTVEYPAGWKYVPQTTADGSVMHMFTAAQAATSISYCHVLQQALNPKLTPQVSSMSTEQVRDFLLARSDESTFSTIYSTLITAPDFKLLRVGPAVLGKDQPAMSGDFTYKIPQGFYYRVTSYYTFWSKGQFSAWCQSASRDPRDAERDYQLNLATFQRFFATIHIRT